MTVFRRVIDSLRGRLRTRAPRAPGEPPVAALPPSTPVAAPPPGTPAASAARSSKPGACDFCSVAMPAGAALLTAETVRAAVRGGFHFSQIQWNAFGQSVAALAQVGSPELAAALRERLFAGCMRRVVTDDTDWLTCPRCRGLIDKALAGSRLGRTLRLGGLHAGHPIDALRLMYHYSPHGPAKANFEAVLTHVVEETTGAALKDIVAQLGPRLKLAENDRVGKAIFETDDGGEELRQVRSEIQAEHPETSGMAYEFHARLLPMGEDGPFGALVFVYGPPLKPEEDGGRCKSGAGIAWYFLLVSDRPDDLQDYGARSLKDFAHPAVNLNLIVDASDLWTSAHPLGYALDAVRRYLAPMQQMTRSSGVVELPDLVSGKSTVEYAEVADCRGKAAMLIRVFDPKQVERGALPANCRWQTL